MTESTRLAAHRASASSAAEHEPINPDMPDDEEVSGEKKDKKKMSDKEQEAAVAQAAADAKKAENARFSAVLASDHYAGREALAKNLLATDLSADQITAALADAAKTAAAGASAEDLAKAKEDGEREAMKAMNAETPNSNIDPNGGGNKTDKKQASSQVWDNVLARMNPNKAA